MTDKGNVGATGADTSRPSLLGRIHLVDLLLIAAVPVVLLAVFRLPAGTREALVFEYTAPSVRTAFTAPFVHFDTGHLLFNIFAYALIVSNIYGLIAASGEYTQFRVVFLSLLVTAPALLSYLNLTIARGGISFGFSGVLMALYGYLPIVVAQHLQSGLGFGGVRRVGPLYFFVGLTLVTVQTLRAVLANPVRVTMRGDQVPVTWVLVASLSGLVVILLLVVMLYVLSLSEVDTESVFQSGSAGHFEMAVLATVLFLIIPFTMFPADPIVGSSVLNLHVHLVGYALGFIASYVYATNNVLFV